MMTAKDTYNSIISYIEDNAAAFDKSDQDIAYELTREYARNVRDLGTIFNFMVGKTVLKYISDRKLMASYRHLIEAKELDIKSAIEISTYDNHSSYCKKFSEVFKMSPKEAYKKKDSTLLIPPLTWDAISCNENKNSTEGDDRSMMPSTDVFGVSKEQYDRVLEAYSLEGLYGFQSVFSKLAYELSEDLKISLADSFKYISSIRDYDDSLPHIRRLPASAEKTLRSIAFDPYIQFMHFQYNLSVSTAFDLLERTHLSESTLMSLDRNLLREYAFTDDFDFKYFERAYHYYMQYRTGDYEEEDFDRFIDYISVGYSIEDAFDEIIPTGGIIDTDNYTEDDDMFYDIDMIGREAEENDLWNGIRIDINYDEDNPADYC